MQTLRGLRADECLNERVCGLRVQRQRISERLQFGAFVEERLLESVSAGVEILLYGVERGV